MGQLHLFVSDNVRYGFIPELFIALFDHSSVREGLTHHHICMIFYLFIIFLLYHVYCISACICVIIKYITNLCNSIQILSVSEPVYNPLSQDQVDYIAKNIKIQYDILNNFAKYAFFSARLSLLNNGSVPISGGNWSIYLFHFSFIEPKYIKNNKSALVCENQFNITHVDGSLYTMSPTSAFVDILPGETREIILTNGNSMVARSDAFPNWYISAPQTIPRIIANTNDETLAFIGDFQSIEKWKRTSSDLFDPYTPEKRYFINADAHDFGQAKKLVIPTPLNLTRVEKVLDLNVDKWSIVFSDDLVMEAHILSGMCQTQVHWWRPIYCQVCVKHKSIDGVPYTVRYVSNTSPNTSEVMRFRDMNEVIQCCIYTITLLLYTRIKLTGIMLIRDINSFIYIDIRKINQNSNDPQPYLTLCEKCSFVVA